MKSEIASPGRGCVGVKGYAMIIIAIQRKNEGSLGKIMKDTINSILKEVQKGIFGKQEVIEKVLMAILANGHILLDDVPGVGKTTLAVVLSKTLGMKYHRIQFTPDVLPSDIVGFSIYNKEDGTFTYMPGIVTNTNLLLADEINRTSSRTQSALLEAMEERQVTVDGTAHPLQNPFLVIATQNQVGTAGTQLLPQAQLDRFLVRLTIGYPDHKTQMEIIRGRQSEDPLSAVQQAADCEEILRLQKRTLAVSMKDEIVAYITDLAVASREHPWLELGISPRGAVAVSHMAKACALLKGRDYVIPEDVREVFTDVCAHRVLLNQKARTERITAEAALQQILKNTAMPFAL